MAKFAFRLQRVLDYRELLEEFAKDAYLEARATRLGAEAELDGIFARKEKLLESDGDTLQDRIALERMLKKLEDDTTQQRIAIDILAAEEEARRADWIEKRKEFESLKKLYDEDLDNWNREEARKEQILSDEWALHRRTG